MILFENNIVNHELRRAALHIELHVRYFIFVSVEAQLLGDVAADIFGINAANLGTRAVVEADVGFRALPVDGIKLNKVHLLLKIDAELHQFVCCRAGGVHRHDSTKCGVIDYPVADVAGGHRGDGQLVIFPRPGNGLRGDFFKVIQSGVQLAFGYGEAPAVAVGAAVARFGTEHPVAGAERIRRGERPLAAGVGDGGVAGAVRLANFAVLNHHQRVGLGGAAQFRRGVVGGAAVLNQAGD